MKTLLHFLRKKEGAVMIEYVLLASLIGVLLVVIMTGLKDALWDTFQTVVTALGGGIVTPPS